MIELRDELELPGTVIMHKITTRHEVIQRLKKILEDFEVKGYKTFNEIPECPEKQE